MHSATRNSYIDMLKEHEGSMSCYGLSSDVKKQFLTIQMSILGELVASYKEMFEGIE